MSRIVTTQKEVFQFSELDDRAKERARSLVRLVHNGVTP
jgi:hypothetical protein